MFYQRKWWKEAIGYQIYLKSFKDSNNDGIGDLNGIREKLPYLKELGITLIWITPFYLSPMDDNGYDISDFYQVDPAFGSLDDIKNLLKEAHDIGIRVIVDFVMNHTSDEHHWFVEARKSKSNKYRDYYLWAKGKIVDGKEVEPTNWASFFGGSCWEKDELTDEYYMKIFSKKMPDLNYRNPEVRKEMQEVAKYWLDLGVDGFRIDAVAHLGRSEELIDSNLKTDNKYQPDWRKFSNLPVLFDYLKEFKENVFDHYEIVTIGEVGGDASAKEAIAYAGYKNGPLKMVFNFDHCWSNNVWQLEKSSETVKVDLLNLKQVFDKWQRKQYQKAWAPLYWLNHDHPRLMSHYGNPQKRFLSGSMLATALYFMWGTPFVYQGEEIGTTNYPFKDIREFNDVGVKNSYENSLFKSLEEEKKFIFQTALKSRDNARTIMSWNASKYGGFSQSEPWFHLHPDYRSVNVAAQLNDPDSLLTYYKKVFELRKSEPYLSTFVYGSYQQLLKRNPHLYIYLREKEKKILVITNFFDQERVVNLPRFKVKKILLSNYSDTRTILANVLLRPYESIVYEVEK